MEEIYLVTPSLEHEKPYYEMLSEWEAIEHRIYPGAVRLRGMDYINWLKYLEINKNKETCPSHLAPSDTFFLMNNYNRIIGAISIRHYLNEELLETGGHIGYGIRPTERKKEYAKNMLKMAIEKCKTMGMKRVLITCNKDNIASAKTIISNGGVLENEVVESNGNIVQRYWIQIESSSMIDK